jgi:hypothetical protein
MPHSDRIVMLGWDVLRTEPVEFLDALPQRLGHVSGSLRRVTDVEQSVGRLSARWRRVPLPVGRIAES